MCARSITTGGLGELSEPGLYEVCAMLSTYLVGIKRVPRLFDHSFQSINRSGFAQWPP